MGTVMVTFKVMPESLEVDINSLAKEISGIKEWRVNKVEKKPIAFGLFALMPSFVIDDAGGIVEKIEERIKGIKGVKSAEVTDVTLV